MKEADARLLFERSYAAWSAADAEALVPLYHPECVWDNRPIPIDPKLYRGHDDLRDAVADWFAHWDRFEVAIAELTQLSDEVFLIVGRGQGIGRGGGVPVDLPPLFQIARVREGLILRVANYVDRDRALADADVP